MGCDSGGGPSGPGGTGNPGGSSFTATIDGSSWASRTETIAVSGNPGDPETSPLTITGIDAVGSGISLYLAYIDGPGSYPLGVNAFSNAGGTAQVSVLPGAWLTPLSGSAGTVEITTRTATRIAGRFAFTADLVLGGSPPQRTVTGGQFDITVASGLPALPTGTASALNATVGGAPWNAATLVTTSGGASSFGLSASSTQWQLTAVNQVPVAAGNSYAVPSEISMTMIEVSSGDAWTVVGGGAPLTIGGGEFDITFFTP